MSRAETFVPLVERQEVLAGITTMREASYMIQFLLAGNIPSTTKCIACLNMRQTDEDGLCRTCQPASEEARAALIALLKEPTEWRVIPQETSVHE